MRDKAVTLDRGCHMLCSRKYKKQIRKKPALHYPPVEAEDRWDQVRRQSDK